MNNAAPIINTPNNETINPNQPLSENNIINSNYISFSSLLTKKNNTNDNENKNLNINISPTNNQNSPFIEHYPKKTQFSIKYSENEIEIIELTDSQIKGIFWLIIPIFYILCCPIFCFAFIIQCFYCPRYMLSRAYISKKGDDIIIKRKERNTCYLLYPRSHSYISNFDISEFKYKFVNSMVYSQYNSYQNEKICQFYYVTNSGIEDVILDVQQINQNQIEDILSFLNSLLDKNKIDI